MHVPLFAGHDSSFVPLPSITNRADLEVPELPPAAETGPSTALKELDGREHAPCRVVEVGCQRLAAAGDLLKYTAVRLEQNRTHASKKHSVEIGMLKSRCDSTCASSVKHCLQAKLVCLPQGSH
jgi:hypothetical protein